MKNEKDCNNILIRLMNIEDIDEVIDIEKSSFDTPWSKSSFESEILHNNLAYYFVAEYNGHVIGYAGMWFVIDEGHITNIAIHPVCRGKGWGEKLVRFMIEYAYGLGVKSLTLEVRTTNEPAIGLYEKIGFVGHGIRKGYYQETNEDALIMWIEI